ncbi:MAG: hypothetical protein ACRC6M_09930 [Microcystaceae cyanobacterium]
MAKSQNFEETYPNLARFIDGGSGGCIELGDSEQVDSFARAYDMGGTIYEGKSSYKTIDAALQDLEKHVAEYMEENGID